MNETLSNRGSMSDDQRRAMFARMRGGGGGGGQPANSPAETTPNGIEITKNAHGATRAKNGWLIEMERANQEARENGQLTPEMEARNTRLGREYWSAVYRGDLRAAQKMFPEVPTQRILADIDVVSPKNNAAHVETVTTPNGAVRAKNGWLLQLTEENKALKDSGKLSREEQADLDAMGRAYWSAVYNGNFGKAQKMFPTVGIDRILDDILVTRASMTPD